MNRTFTSLALAATVACAGSISGRVLDAATGNPVADAQVVAKSGNRDASRAQTSEGGDYRIGELEPGSYDVGVTARGYGDARYPRQVAVRADQVTEDITFRLAKEQPEPGDTAPRPDDVAVIQDNLTLIMWLVNNSESSDAHLRELFRRHAGRVLDKYGLTDKVHLRAAVVLPADACVLIGDDADNVLIPYFQSDSIWCNIPSLALDSCDGLPRVDFRGKGLVDVRVQGDEYSLGPPEGLQARVQDRVWVFHNGDWAKQ
jgi:hypothetical protein